MLELGDYRQADRLRWHEREQHRDMRWDAEPRIGNESFPVPSHDGLSFWDLDEQDALRTWVRHGKNATAKDAPAVSAQPIEQELVQSVERV